MLLLVQMVNIDDVHEGSKIFHCGKARGIIPCKISSRYSLLSLYYVILNIMLEKVQNLNFML